MANGRIEIPGMPGGIPMGGAPPMVLATPMNDVQILAMLAAQHPSASVKPGEAIDWAIELFALSVVRSGRGRKILQRIDELEKAPQAVQEK